MLMVQAVNAEPTETTRPAPSAPAAVTTGFTLRDLLISAFYHIRIVLLAAILPLVVAITAAAFAHTEYTAESLLMVILNRQFSNAQNVTDSGPAVLTIEGLKQVESEVQIIESADVARATVEQIGADRLFPPGRLSILGRLLGSAERDRLEAAVDRFRANVHASVVSDSNVIRVSFTNPDRAVTIEATDALVKNYLAARRRLFENPTAKILMLEVNRFKQDLSSVDQEIERLKGKVGIIDFGQDSALAANQVDSILQRRRQTAEREVAVGAQLAEAERQLSGLPDSVFDFSENTNALPGDEDANTLTRLLVERDRIVAQYAPNSPLLRELDKQLATVRARIKSRSDRRYYTDRAVRNPQLNYLQNMILSLKVEQDSLSRQKSELVEQQRVAEERLAALRSAETPLIELNRRRDSLSETFREYERRAVAASIEEAAAQSRQSSVRVVQEAGSAVTRRSLALPLVAAGIFAGLLFGGAAGAIASTLRTSFIMPSEAERALELPAIAVFDEDAEHPENFAADQAIGSCATMLLDTRIDDEPLRTMHLLSPDADEALPWFARHLAEEFARQRGKRTLLVDLCSSSSYPFAGGSTEMRGGLAVSGTPVPLLWVAAGDARAPMLDVRLPISDAEMMMSELKQVFDCVVVCSDLPGASLVTQRFCQLVDGNILAVQAEKTRKPAAIHLRDSVIESRGLLFGFIFLGRRYYLPHWLYHRA